MSENTPDPRLTPTPDYGSLGPGSDLPAERTLVRQGKSLRPMFAVIVGILLAMPFVASGAARTTWEQIEQLLSLHGKPEPASPAILSEHETLELDGMQPQSQAQLLLERAINHYVGATRQIEERVNGWHGNIKMTPALNSLFTTALNSNDLRVRAAAIEVDLAALNVDKSAASIDRLESQASSGDQSERVWALWTLGLLGNRGVQPERVSGILLIYIHDSNESVRYWAVEGLAYLGTDAVIQPLLQIFHDDPSANIRERAACGLAQSGMLSEKQRKTVVPQLIDFASDPALDGQTRTWVYQALQDITGQSLPSDPNAWRSWYNTAGA